LNTLAGAPGIDIDHMNYNKKKMWQTIRAADQNGHYITNANWTNWKGLVGGHAYSVIRVVKLKSIKKKLVLLRNPWGTGEFRGAWSDKSKLWTQEFKDEAGFEDKEDGSFFMAFN